MRVAHTAGLTDGLRGEDGAVAIEGLIGEAVAAQGKVNGFFALTVTGEVGKQIAFELLLALGLGREAEGEAERK